MPTPQPSAASIRWSRRFERFHRSGLTVAAFCQAERVSQAAFYQWQRKLRSEIADSPNDSPSPPPVKFLPVSLVTDEPRRAPLLNDQAGRSAAEHRFAAMTIDLPGGISIRFELPVGEAHPS
jgi:hypothetical protein